MCDNSGIDRLHGGAVQFHRHPKRDRLGHSRRGMSSEGMVGDCNSPPRRSTSQMEPGRRLQRQRYPGLDISDGTSVDCDDGSGSLRVLECWSCDSPGDVPTFCVADDVTPVDLIVIRPYGGGINSKSNPVCTNRELPSHRQQFDGCQGGSLWWTSNLNQARHRAVCLHRTPRSSPVEGNHDNTKGELNPRS